MKILVIGSGAREHIIAKTLSKTADVFAYMSKKNPGLVAVSEKYIVDDESDFDKIVEFAKDNDVDMAFIGPEAPLEKGVVDVLNDNGIDCVGPTAKAAQIETNKAFMRQLFVDYDIDGSLNYGTFYDIDEAYDFIDELDGPVVVKPIGLTGGKGVKIVGDQLADNQEAKEYVKEIFDQKMSGYAGVVLEELLLGEEYTIQAFVDGKNLVAMPAAQDHPHAFEGNIGPITGGMGSYSDSNHLLPFLSQDEYDESVSIMQQTVDAIAKEEEPYKGILYGQFMLTRDGPKIIEYNARFGDPEAMNVLALLEDDFAKISKQIVDGTLTDAKFQNKASVCKYVVPDKYPNTKAADTIVEVDEKAINDNDAQVCYAAVYLDDNDDIRLTSSRAIAVLAVADTIKEAEGTCENAIGYIKGDVYHRSDVATEELLDEKIEHMKEVKQ